MPNRIFRDGFVDSQAVASLSDWAHRLYSNLLVRVDDAGRFDGRLEILRSHLMPLGTSRRNDDFSTAISEMERSNLIVQYTFGPKPLIQVTKWQKCGKSLSSKYPWKDGGFSIEYTTIGTRDGPKEFVSTSVPIVTPSTPGKDGVTPKTNTETETETETETLDGGASGDGTSAGPDPANVLAGLVGLGQNCNDRMRGEIRRLIALNGCEHARSALERSVSAKGPTIAAVQYAGGIVKREMKDGEVPPKQKTPLKDRPRTVKYAS